MRKFDNIMKSCGSSGFQKYEVSIVTIYNLVLAYIILRSIGVGTACGRRRRNFFNFSFGAAYCIYFSVMVFYSSGSLQIVFGKNIVLPQFTAIAMLSRCCRLLNRNATHPHLGGIISGQAAALNSFEDLHQLCGLSLTL